MLKKIIPATVAAAALAVSLSACGSYAEAHDYNAPAPTSNVKADWTRIETPYHYSTMIMTCLGRDGIYDTLANDSSVDVVPNDPACAK